MPQPAGTPEQRIPLVEVLRAVAWKTVDLGAGPGVAVTASRRVIGGQVGEIGGWSLAETTGAGVADLRLWDGGLQGGLIVARINLAANESTRDLFPERGVSIQTGVIWVEILAGSVEGVIYWR